jgi:hypothetical protein
MVQGKVKRPAAWGMLLSAILIAVGVRRRATPAMHARQSEQYEQQLAYFAEVEAQAEAIRSGIAPD